MENLTLINSLIMLFTLVGGIIMVMGGHWVLLKKQNELNADQKLPRQLIMLVLYIVAIIAVILSLPISESSRNQLLALLGVLLSGVIAFSSTTIVSNLMAGLVLRLNKPFRAGDYIRCQNYAGRVSEKGLLDTEIQTEQRALVHIANSYLVNNPIEVIRSSGTIITADISLGYDVHHKQIEKYLLKAAQNSGLNDAFVHIIALGDFSVNYRVAGLLIDTKSMLTSKSALHACILDEMHSHNVEIMSPTIMAQRRVDPAYQFMAKPKTKGIADADASTKVETIKQEDLAFDKAEEAEKYELEK